MSGAERQARYRARRKAAKLAAVPSLAPVGAAAAPAELGQAGAKLWNWVTGDDDDALALDLGCHEQALLLAACRASDRLEAIAAELDRAPLTYVNARGDVLPNPLLNESRQQSLLLARLFAALQLPAGEEDEVPGPERSPRRTHRPAFRGVYQPRRGA